MIKICKLPKYRYENNVKNEKEKENFPDFLICPFECIPLLCNAVSSNCFVTKALKNLHIISVLLFSVSVISCCSCCCCCRKKKKQKNDKNCAKSSFLQQNKHMTTYFLFLPLFLF